MSDSKVSELTSATSLGVSDYLYVVQSNASKKITAATMFANAANVTLSGNLNFQSTVQLVTSAGTKIDLTKPISHLAADASGGTIFIPAGTTNQVKYIVMISTSGGSFIISSNVPIVKLLHLVQMVKQRSCYTPIVSGTWLEVQPQSLNYEST